MRVCHGCFCSFPLLMFYPTVSLFLPTVDVSYRRLFCGGFWNNILGLIQLGEGE